ncbi:MAG: hypothetical protein E7077_02210 [Bacteroidales bacterium]|jgi:hypothetical protein|nr:hypothetical protein [Bacteroidales bacterium]
MINVNYNTGRRFVERIGDQCSILSTIDDWENVCGCYTFDLEGRYLFLYSENGKIIFEYKGKKYPIAMCVCSFHSKESIEKFWEAREIWKIEIFDKGNLLCEAYYKGGYEDSEYETSNLNFGQYITKLKGNEEFRDWYLSNHSQNIFTPKIYLSRLSFTSSKISFDGTQIQMVDASSPMQDGFFELDTEGTCSMLYVENQKLILFYKNNKFFLDDSELTIDCETCSDKEKNVYNLTIKNGSTSTKMQYVCPSPDFWGDDEEWEYNWGCYIKKIKENEVFRKQIYDKIMFSKKR